MGFVHGETLHQLLEVLAGEALVEGLGDAVPVALEGVKGARECSIERLERHSPNLVPVHLPAARFWL